MDNFSSLHELQYPIITQELQDRAHIAETHVEDGPLPADVANRTKETIAEFLCLVFGIGANSSAFWDDILIPRAVKKFGVQEASLERQGINLHALLHAVRYHAHLAFDGFDPTGLGKTSTPFTPDMIREIEDSAQVYSL
jgi:hypothetical protein